MSVTKEQAKAAITVIRIMADAVKEASAEPQGVIPSGHLYALMMTLPGVTLDVYEKMEGILIESGRVTKSNNFLKWVA